ncbi:MAG TPA: NADH-quinone oxidoreductase subunit N [Candidatus Kapabacteria bacterium]|nr:NADH-quinone oxidoreductase subunit N [Candidatus Kapabacteria bacterium]
MTSQEILVALLPVIILSSCALLMMLVDSFMAHRRIFSFEIGILGYVAAVVAGIYNFQWQGTAFGGMIAFGGFANFFAVLFSMGGLLAFLFARPYLKKENINHAEFYCLLMFATVGMMLMAAAHDLIIVFIGLELMSISFYILAGFARTTTSSNEAGLKYFLLGAFATGFLLYGIALVYGVTGSTNFDTIRGMLSSVNHQPMFWLGGALIFIAFAFKISAVPFHMWAPDVYEGAPTAVTGWMSSVGKAAAFSAVVLVGINIFGAGAEKFKIIVAVISTVTMLYGNITALMQQNVKRMLAYSSIAHAGYALIGVAAASPLGSSAVLFYVATYVFMQAGAFGIAGEFEREGGKNLLISDYAGLGARKPMLAVIFAVFMFSLAGIPPLGGFFGKYYLFIAAVQSGMTWLAVVGVISSIISIYFYIGLVVKMFFQDAVSTEPLTVSGAGSIAMWLACLAVFLLGIFPSAIVDTVIRLF